MGAQDSYYFCSEAFFISIPLVEGKGVTPFHFFSYPVFLHLTLLWFSIPNSFLIQEANWSCPKCTRARVHPSTTTKLRNVSRAAQLQATTLFMMRRSQDSMIRKPSSCSWQQQKLPSRDSWDLDHSSMTTAASEVQALQPKWGHWA